MEHCACAMRDFISCSFSSSSLTFSLQVTPCNSGLSLVGPALPFQPRLQGGPDLISSSNSKDDDVLPGKRWTWMQRWKQCCVLLLLMLCLAISAQANPDSAVRPV